MLEKDDNGKYRIYYSFWLADKDVPSAFHKFRTMVEATNPTKINLEPNDILVIDNRRILHARGAISEDSRRHLIRYWIEKQVNH
jgi:alpha-ketoglutarate-dependent taurine dioxygenase